jgi:eukaryotic-like serine/threonine-protein kinase
VTKRAPAHPPTLAGFRHISHIGSGGYADVFLYEQEAPNRRVAIKVVDPAAVPGGLGPEHFTVEANLMAKVSAHPYIVQVFQTAIAPDGRPYLVMEYYPGPNFYERARSEQITVAEALRVGVQLASAVETAHRAGILHRDIKPANVLTSEYWRPGLTDFGIAAAQGPGVDTADGVSIPWSPPEALGDAPADRRSDVYSLAATIYNLVAGRSPFEIQGGDNRHLALIGRIERHPVPSIGRADTPASLERVLANAMAKDPAHRPSTAAEFGRQLQAIESEMRLAVTVLELADETRSVRMRADEVDDDSTRVKGVRELRAQEPDGPRTPAIASIPAAPTGSTATIPPRPREGMLAEPELGDTVVRPGRPEIDERNDGSPMPVASRSVPRGVVIGGVAAAGVALAVVTSVLVGGEGGADLDTATVDAAEVNVELDMPVAAPPSPLAAVTGMPAGDGTFTFSWDDRGAGFSYAVTPDGALGPDEVTSPEYRSPTNCIEVVVISERTDLLSAPTRGCA